MTWQTIESAPKNGADILLYAPSYAYGKEQTGERVTVGHWTIEEECREYVGDCGGVCRCPEYDEVEPSWLTWDGGFLPEYPPTHWQPLPSGPKSWKSSIARILSGLKSFSTTMIGKFLGVNE